METISILVERSRSGDREAFARIVKQYQGMVSAATLNVVGNYAQSEDLAQETFLTAWRKLPELREPEKLASWLYGIARQLGHLTFRWQEDSILLGSVLFWLSCFVLSGALGLYAFRRKH